MADVGLVGGRVRRGAKPGRREVRTIRWAGDDGSRDLIVRGGLALRWTACGDEPGMPGMISVDAAFMAGERAVGCMSLHEFRPPPEFDAEADTFREWVRRMRMPGADAAAEAMCAGWLPGDVREAGALVWFSRLWVEPAHARGGIWPSVAEFLSRRYGPSGEAAGALLLLKPFPLEYEGAFTEGDLVPEGPLRLRRAALERLYAAKLGAHALDGTGWMWRALDPNLPPPKPSPAPGFR